MSDLRAPAVVVGGGIAGLAAAYRLQTLGVDALVIESDPVPGGKVRTARTDGFVIEEGPDSFISEKPQARQLAEELGIGDEIIGTNDEHRKNFLISKGRLRPMPEGFIMLAPVKPIPLLRSRLVSIPGVLRMAMEPFVPTRKETTDEALGGFVSRRFGKEVLEKIVDPLLSGIFAGDSNRLSLDSTFPRLRDLERKYGSLIRGLLTTHHQMKKMPKSGRTMFQSFRGGLARLIEVLVERLRPGSVLTGTSVTAVARYGEGWALTLSDGRRVMTGEVVFATPSFVTAALLRGLDGKLGQLLDSIPYVSTATIALAYRRSEFPHPLDGFGFVVPRTEKRRITACTWVSTKMSYRAPDDSVLLRCFMGRDGDESWVGMSDAEMVEVCRGELASLMGITVAPTFTRVTRWMRAMPQYLVGHQDLLRAIDRHLEAFPGLHLTGSAYRGVGLPDCIKEADATARKAAERLRAPSVSAAAVSPASR